MTPTIQDAQLAWIHAIRTANLPCWQIVQEQLPLRDRMTVMEWIEDRLPQDVRQF